MKENISEIVTTLLLSPFYYVRIVILVINSTYPNLARRDIHATSNINTFKVNSI